MIAKMIVCVIVYILTAMTVNYRKNGLDIFASAKEWQYRTGNWSDLGQQTTDPVTGEGMFDYIGTMNHFWKGIGTHYYGSYTVAQNNKYDFNRVVLTVRYNFNTARSKYKGTGAGQDARSRFGGDKK